MHSAKALMIVATLTTVCLAPAASAWPDPLSERIPQEVYDLLPPPGEETTSGALDKSDAMGRDAVRLQQDARDRFNSRIFFFCNNLDRFSPVPFWCPDDLV